MNLTVTGIVPDYASIGYEPYMYRVWRLCDGIRNFTYNDNDELVNDPLSPRESDLLVASTITGERVVNFVDEGMTFGAVNGSDVSFLVRFYYVKVGQAGNPGAVYYVVDRIADNIKWNDITTGVDEITVAEPVKTYVNAQGLTSDKPFDGLNIVITRYSDGTVKTSKIFK